MTCRRRAVPRLMAVLLSACAPAVSATPPMPAALSGSWEGEAATPRRPLVMLVDFDSMQARFNTTGSTRFPLHALATTRDSVSFGVVAGRDTLPVQLRRDGTWLRGSTVLGGERYTLALRQLPELPPPSTREDAWRQDLEVVIDRFLRYDRSFSPAARAAFIARIAALRDSVALLGDNRLMVELARAFALSDNAHTRLYLVRNRTAVRRMPFRVWSFDDGYRVVRAGEQQRDLLGCELTRVEEMEIAAALERVRGIKPGNDQWQRYMNAYMLVSPEILSGSGFGNDGTSARYEFRCNGRRVTRTIEALPLEPGSTTVESWWDLSPFAARNAAVPLSALPAERAPLYLRSADVNYSYELLPDGLLYFQYNRAQNNPAGPPLRDFAAGLLRTLDSAAVRALVVDLRFNTGGDLGIAGELMRSLHDQLRGRPAFVITSRATFSAGITHVVEWKERGATIVGEHVGDELDTWSEGGNIELPNSKLIAHYTNGFHGYSRRAYPEREPFFKDLNVDTVAPDVPVGLKWAEYIQGADPSLEAVRQRLPSR